MIHHRSPVAWRESAQHDIARGETRNGPITWKLADFWPQNGKVPKQQEMWQAYSSSYWRVVAFLDLSSISESRSVRVRLCCCSCCLLGENMADSWTVFDRGAAPNGAADVGAAKWGVRCN